MIGGVGCTLLGQRSSNLILHHRCPREVPHQYLWIRASASKGGLLSLEGVQLPTRPNQSIEKPNSTVGLGRFLFHSQGVATKCSRIPTFTLQRRAFSAQHYNFFSKNWQRITLYNDISYKGHGWPLMWVVTATKPAWQPHLEEDYQTVARDELGIPMQIPPEVSTKIKHMYYVPPQYYPFLKKLGDDTPALMPYVEKLIQRQFTREDYEEMFYSFAKPLRVHRKHIPLPYRSTEEMRNTPVVNWEGAWSSYRQRVHGEYGTHQVAKDWVISMLFASYLSYSWVEQTRYGRVAAKLYYLDAPEHKINWVKPRGDL